MKIKFETEDECYCVTPCPYGFTDGYTGEPKKVGSNGCSECKYFKSTDIDNNEVDCFYQEHETEMFLREFCDGHKRGN